MRKTVIIIIVAVALVATLAFLRRKVGEFDDAEHERFQTALWQIKQLDTTFNEDLLKSRFALVDNYDDFQMRAVELDRSLETLRQPPGFITPVGRMAITNAHGEYLAILAEREKLFERFKTQNATVSNARRYLPGALEELSARLAAGAATNQDNLALQSVTANVSRLLLRRLATTEDTTEDAQARLKQLKDWCASHPQHPEARFAGSLVRHAETIVKGSGAVDAMTRELLALPTGAVIQKLFRAYESEVTGALGRTQQFRVMLYALGVVALLGLAYTFWALRAANRNLENRVLARTAELFEKNSGLENAITEQQRMATALRESQSLYDSLVEHLPAGIFRKDFAGRFVFVNSWFCRLKRLKPEQILGKTPLELATLELATDTTANPQAAQVTHMASQGVDDHGTMLRTGQPLERDEEYSLADGSAMYLHVIKSPVFGADGKIAGSQGMMLDVTASRRAEIALAFERELLRSLLDSSHDFVYFKDRDSRFIRCSRTLAKSFGVDDPELVVGKTDFDFFGEAHAHPAFEDEQKIIRTGQPLIGKVEKEVWKDGHETWALTTKMTLRNKDGEIIGTFGISKDITAIKEAETRLEEVHKQLLETSRQAGMAEVATGVLHNVGNVLNSVNVSATCIADGVRKSKSANLAKVVALLRAHEMDLGPFLTNDEKGRQIPGYLAQLADHLAGEQAAAQKELAELQKHIDHIKDIVTMQQNFAKVSGVKESLPVSELVEDALRLNAASLAHHGVQVIRDFSAAPVISVEKHKALQILVNLVRNAKQACDEANRDVKQMTLRILNGDDRVRISITDNGVGIPSENLTRIFNHGFTTKKEGHGFGLHNAANAATEMGGTLSVYSDGPGAGATFTLELPCARQPA